jgi:hypothetical protein
MEKIYFKGEFNIDSVCYLFKWMYMILRYGLE